MKVGIRHTIYLNEYTIDVVKRLKHPEETVGDYVRYIGERNGWGGFDKVIHKELVKISKEYAEEDRVAEAKFNAHYNGDGQSCGNSQKYLDYDLQ